MGNRNYWLDLFSIETWKEFLAAGGEVSGHREKRWNTIQQIKPGDYLLAYLTGVSRFIAILEVVSPPYRDNIRIWKEDVFPCRLKVKILESLTPETAVPVINLKDKLSLFHNLSHANAWTIHFRRSPSKYKISDGEAIVKAIKEAKLNPVSRPISKTKLAPRPKGIKVKIGEVTIPEPEIEGKLQGEDAAVKESSLHDEIQWLLLKFGNDMGLDVWVAKNDRNKSVRNHRFTDLQRLKDRLPVQFDEATNRTIELIDVLWLKGNSITAAFEIESTTSIYSGLLRMADLISMHPNLTIPLYLVVPDERRNKVITEVNRPTFSCLSPPLSHLCRLITFSSLRQRINKLEKSIALSYVRPEFLEELSESCEVEEG